MLKLMINASVAREVMRLERGRSCEEESAAWLSHDKLDSLVARGAECHHPVRRTAATTRQPAPMLPVELPCSKLVPLEL